MEELELHTENECQFEKIKDFLWRTETKINDLQNKVTQKDDEIGFLRSMLGKLSERVEMLEKSTEDKIGKLASFMKILFL